MSPGWTWLIFDKNSEKNAEKDVLKNLLCDIAVGEDVSQVCLRDDRLWNPGISTSDPNNLGNKNVNVHSRSDGGGQNLGSL